MKHISKFTVVAVILLSSFTASAQKIAHINLDSLISLMPESEKAKKEQEAYIKELETMIGTMQSEFDTKYQDYVTNQAKYSAVIKSTMEKELKDLDNRIQEFRMTAQQDLQKKSAELAEPIYDMAKKAIDEVAKANGYKYVLDTSSGTVLVTDESADILKLTMKKLGITEKPAAPAPQK